MYNHLKWIYSPPIQHESFNWEERHRIHTDGYGTRLLIKAFFTNSYEYWLLSNPNYDIRYILWWQLNINGTQVIKNEAVIFKTRKTSSSLAV